MATAAPAQPSRWQRLRSSRGARALHGLIGVLTLIFACLAGFLLVAVMSAQYLFGFEMRTEKSDSMKPIMQAGDVVVLKRYTIDEAQEGDIIAFKRDDGEIMLHRLLIKRPRYLDRQKNSGAFTKWDLRTKGDAVRIWDEPWQMQRGGYVKEFYLAIPKLGYVLRWFRQPLMLGICIALLVAIVLAYLWGLVKPDDDDPTALDASATT